MEKSIDAERLRRDLEDYFGTAMNNGFPFAIAELSEVRRASVRELIRIAEKNGFNMDDYEE